MKNLSKLHIFIIVLVTSLVLLSIAYLYNKAETRQILKVRREYLEAVSNLKLEQVNSWKKTRTDDANFFPTIGRFIKYTDYLVNSVNTAEAKSYFSKTLFDQFVSNGYDENVLITDVKGRILFSADSSFTEIDPDRLREIINSINKGGVTFGDFYFDKKRNKSLINIISVIRNNNKIPIGVFVQQVDVERSLLSLIQRWPAPSKTAETLLFMKDGDSIVYLNELRHKKNTALKLKIPLSQTDVVAVKGALGQRGIYEGIDYRGIEVLAGIIPIPGTDWFMISKIDKSEILEELYFRAQIVILLVLLSILLFITFALYYYKLQQSRVLRNLILKQKELSETQEEFKTALYSIGDGVITADTYGKVKQMNFVAEKLTGWKEATAKGKSLSNVFKVVDEVTGKPVNNSADLFLEKRVILGVAVHKILISVDGKQIPVADSGAPIKDSINNIIGVVLVFRDQTEERVKEKLLLEGEERLRLSLKAANQGFFDINIQTDEIIVNEEYAKMFGYEPNSVKGALQLLLERTHPDDKVNVRKTYKDYLDGKISEYLVEFRQLTKDERLKWILSTGKIVEWDKDGKPLRLLGTNTDITTIKLAEERFRLIWEDSIDAMRLIDGDGIIHNVNDAYCKWFGLKRQELIGKPFNVSYIVRDKDTSLNSFKERFRTRTIQKQFETEIQLKNKEFIWVELTNSFIEFEDKNILLLSIFRDITDRKNLINQLIEAKTKAEEMNRVKGFFFANMSHELRTPFVGIMGFAELLSETLQNDEEKEMAHQILKSSRRLTDTLNKILNVTRLEFDSVELQNDELDVCQVLKDTELLYSNAAKLKDTTITTETSEKKILFHTDKNILEEILNNLVSNAVRFTENGNIKLAAFTVANDNKESLIIKVTDTGIGISKDKQHIIWQEFRQVSEGYNRSFEGSGLGLTITKKYVELLGGQITLESEKNVGSVFTVTLPINNKVEIKKPEAVQTKIPKPVLSKNKNRKYKVLYVEDDVIALNYISIVLKPLYDVTTEYGAEAALEKTKTEQYDLLMLDVNLGKGMDGVELMQKIRKMDNYKTTPIAAVTAYATQSDKEEFLAKGFSHYISKPFSSEDLKTLLSTMCALSVDQE